MSPAGALYPGVVVHKRLRPKAHALRYRVFCLLLDVDRIAEVTGRVRLFSYNRFNAVSFYDRDHGGFEGKSVAQHARDTFAAAGLDHASARVMLLCYPRILGYGFNPISVFYGYDASGRLTGVIYEVNNTFGERRSYVVALTQPAQPDATHAHGCRKELYVSPFTGMTVRYSFRLSDPGSELTLGVALRDDAGPLMKTHFRGRSQALSTAGLAWQLLAVPMLSFKVMAGIHYEALKLWLKGVPLTTRPPAPRYGVTRVTANPACPQVKV